jgi:hypothetical protein
LPFPPAFGAAVAAVEKPDECRYTYVRSTELPIAAAAVLIFVSTAMFVMRRNRDLHNNRQPLRYQLGQIATAGLIALAYTALAQMVLDQHGCD